MGVLLRGGGAFPARGDGSCPCLYPSPRLAITGAVPSRPAPFPNLGPVLKLCPSPAVLVGSDPRPVLLAFSVGAGNTLSLEWKVPSPCLRLFLKNPGTPLRQYAPCSVAVHFPVFEESSELVPFEVREAPLVAAQVVGPVALVSVAVPILHLACHASATGN